MKSTIDIAGAVEFIEQQEIDKLTEIGQTLVSNMSAITPTKSGNLKGSMVSMVDKEKKSVLAGTPVDYAAYEEFGTGEYAEDGNGRKGGWVYSDAEGNFHHTYGNKPARMVRDGLNNSIDTIKEILNVK